MSDDKKSPQSFEDSLAELETIVQEMERGELSLEVALEKFERGIQLSRQGQQTLNQAEQKIQILLNEQGAQTLKPFQEDGEGA